MHQEIALGVYSLAGPSPPQVALQGPWEAFLTVNKQCVAMMLTWPWWSLEGSLLVGACRIGHSPKKGLDFVVTPLSRGEFEFKVSQANRPYLRSRALNAWERKEEVVGISDDWKLWLKKLHSNMCVCQHIEFLYKGTWYTLGGIPDSVVRGIFWFQVGILYATWCICLHQ
jgi:hypothetical protein